MRTPLHETAPPREEEEQEREKVKTTGVLQNHLGPKTRETELRLGFCSDGFEDAGSVEEDDGQKKLPAFVLRQKNGGLGAKRWFSETEGGFANHPWRAQEKVFFDPSHQQRRMEACSAAAARAPQVVGWPPVGAFRKNLASQPKMEPKVAAATTSVAEVHKAAEESMYVKVNIDGFAVGRKINLKAHNSYDSLSRALQKMFNNFFSIDYFKNQEQSDEDGTVNSDHVLIYEDNEGDRMLVGDVPWEMFISSVKRLYIISGAKAPPVVAGKMATKEKQ